MKTKISSVDCMTQLFAYTYYLSEQLNITKMEYTQVAQNYNRLILQTKECGKAAGISKKDFNKALFPVFAWIDETLLDTGWDPNNWQNKTVKDLRGILKYVDYFIPNMDEAKALTGKDTPEKAAEVLFSDGCKTVIIKLGEKGSYLLTSKQEVFVPAYKVKVFESGSIKLNSVSSSGSESFTIRILLMTPS